MSNKIAVVLPKLSRFDDNNPTSIDSVVRELVQNSSMRERHIVFRPPTLQPIASVASTEFRHDNPLLWKRRLKKAIAAVAPCCIEVHQSIYLADYMARNFSHLPVILFRHNLIDVPGSVIKQKKVYAKLNNISYFMFVSEFSADHFKLSWPDFARRIQVVPNIASKEAWFNPISADRQNKIIFSGRPIEVKGFSEFCEGIVPVLQRHQDWMAQLMIYEWERHKPYARAVIEKLTQAAKNVEVFIDRPIQEVRHLTKSAQIAVIPSKWQEPFGLVALETHLAGLAVISSGRGGLREISGEAAHYLPEVTPDAIAGAVSFLIGHPALRRQLQHAGQKRCIDLFSPARITKHYDEIKQSLILNARNKATASGRGIRDDGLN